MERGNANWEANGQAIQAKFDATATCTEPIWAPPESKSIGQFPRELPSTLGFLTGTRIWFFKYYIKISVPTGTRNESEFPSPIPSS